MEELPSSPCTESATVSELATPLTLSGRTSPFSDDQHSVEPTVTTQKKKKKKRSKKSLTPKGSTSEGKDVTSNEGRSPVLCISRNKHWKYISSYHGPWLQLPVELLDTLLTVNLNPATMVASEVRLVLPLIVGNGRRHRDRGTLTGGDFTPAESLVPNPLTPPLLLPPSSLANPNKPAPPQIDPGVFKSVLNIRRLIDEASELSVRATSGLSSAELGSLRSTSSLTANSWATAHSLGINPLGNGGGRNTTMSANRIYRLRALAVQKLAQAYKADEIASSVMIMQGGSVFDDIAERVLRVDPDDVDAKYVHFFHEKIPSRQLAESTTTKVLDELIAAHPQRLEYYRTRGIVHCFRDEFTQAIKDFTFALKETRSIRKAHHQNLSLKESKQGKRRKGKAALRTNGQAPAEGTSVMEDMDSSDKEHVVTRPSSSEDVPDPLEPQLLFFRGTAYLQQAIYLIESAVLSLEGIKKTPSADGAELRLCYIENGKYGGVETGNPEGPLGKRDGPKLQAYAATLGEKTFKDHISQLLKKSMRDHEKFQSHFDFLTTSDIIQEGDIVSQIQHALLVVESNHRHGKEANAADAPALFATYHPLLIESLFTVLICHLMLADFEAILPLFVRTTAIAEGSEGYPVFLPPRSMAQAEFIEVLERLARGWRNGTQPHSMSNQRGKSRLVDIEKLPSKSSSLLSPPISCSNSYHELETDVIAESSSSTRSGNGFIETPQVVNEALTLDPLRMPTSSEEPSNYYRSDAAKALNCARILLTPVAKRQRDLAQKITAEKSGSKLMKPAPITIPLHGPKVEVILAWLGAVCLPELDA